ncbi:MAG: exopolysaccharide biosynthesis polyprenyl glycosylphosphotransferase [Bacteroidota bacterium]
MKSLNIIQAYNRKKMFKGYKATFNYLLGALDIAVSLSMFFLAFFVVRWTIHPGMAWDNYYYTFILLLVPTLILLLQTTNISRIPRTSRYLAVFFDFVRFTVALAALTFLFVVLFQLKMVSVYVLSLYLILNCFALFFVRILTYHFFKSYRSTGHNTNNIIIIADEQSEPIIDKILDRDEWGFRILMILSNASNIRNKYQGQIKVLPDKINIKNILDIDIVDEVIYSKGTLDNERISNLVSVCEEVGVVFRMQNDLSPIRYEKGFLTNIEEIPMLTIMNTPSNQIAVAWKTITESLFAFLTLLAISPFLLLLSLLIKLDSKGPVIFKQKRVGLRGRQFYIYKFRTMVTNAEELRKKLEAHNEADGPTFKIKNDPRITRIGRFLRKTSLDEVPQLFNVLKGEMALIGPRPPIPSEVAEYERWQLRRLSVKPGLTCTWQIIPNRNDVVFEKWMKLDLQYIDNWSLKNDVSLFFRTIKAVFTNGGY